MANEHTVPGKSFIGYKLGFCSNTKTIKVDCHSLHTPYVGRYVFDPLYSVKPHFKLTLTKWQL